MSDTSHTHRTTLIIGLSFVALALTFSARAALGLVMPVLEQELGWTRTFTSSTAAVALLVMAIIAPFGGRLVDKQGARAILLIGLGALAMGCFLVAVTANPIAFFLAFSGIAAVGFGLVATHVVSTAVEQQVTHNTGLATGIATSGSTGGQFIFVPLLALLISTYDWRMKAQKGHPVKWITVSPEMMDELLALPVRRPKNRKTGKFMKPRVSGYGSSTGYNGRWKTICKRASIQYLSAHQAGRHGFFTELVVRQGVDPVTAAEAGRWADPNLPMRIYAHAETDEADIRARFRTNHVQEDPVQTPKQQKSKKE